MPESLIRIATRKSPLALRQAELVAARLSATNPELRIELVPLTTRGDRWLDSPLARIGGKGLFVKELEQGLLSGDVDIAVHSMKDLPACLPEGLHVPVVLEREDPRDVLISPHCRALEELSAGARVGTSSLRRQSQLKALYPELAVVDLRGNVNTRLQRLDEGRFDAILLAAAGLKRLGMVQCVTAYLEADTLLPAIGQGALGIECRRDDVRVLEWIGHLDHAPTHTCVQAERALNARLGGDCQTPVAGYARLERGELWLRGLVARPDGSEILSAERRGSPGRAADLGAELAEDLLSRGAGRILAAVGQEYQQDEQP